MQDYVDKVTDRLAAEMRTGFESTQRQIEKRWEIDHQEKESRYKLEQEQLDRRFAGQHEQLVLIVEGLDKAREQALETATSLSDKLDTRVKRLEDSTSVFRGRQAAFAWITTTAIAIMAIAAYFITYFATHHV
jgi:hypothetical protein